MRSLFNQISTRASVNYTFNEHWSLAGNAGIYYELPPYLPSAWDNRYILNMSCVWDLPRQLNLGAKLSVIGGSPYTPFDEDKSSLVEAWNASGRPYYDYGLYKPSDSPVLPSWTSASTRTISSGIGAWDGTSASRM